MLRGFRETRRNPTPPRTPPGGRPNRAKRRLRRRQQRCGVRTAGGDSLAISIPRTEAAVIRHFQTRMPYGLVVPDLDAAMELTLDDHDLYSIPPSICAISRSKPGDPRSARLEYAHVRFCQSEFYRDA